MLWESHSPQFLHNYPTTPAPMEVLWRRSNADARRAARVYYCLVASERAQRPEPIPPSLWRFIMRRFYSNRSITAAVASDTSILVWCGNRLLAESDPNRPVLAQMDDAISKLHRFADRMQDLGTFESTQAAMDALDAALELPNALRDALREAGYDRNPYESTCQGWHVLQLVRE